MALFPSTENKNLLVKNQKILQVDYENKQNNVRWWFMQVNFDFMLRWKNSKKLDFGVWEWKTRESLVQACNQRIAVSTLEGVHFTIALETLIVEGG